MTELFRSATMCYVRILLQDDSAVRLMRSLGHLGRLQIADLTKKKDAFDDRHMRLKRRAASCMSAERRFDALRSLCETYSIVLPAPESSLYHDVGLDVLEDALQMIDPIEAALTANVLFKKQQSEVLFSLQERICVIWAVLRRQSSDAKASDPILGQTRGGGLLGQTRSVSSRH